MSKIFISFSQKDRELHDTLHNALIDEGHVLLGVDSLTVGADLSKELNELLFSADAVVALITENSLQSKNVLNEITIAQAQMEAMGKKAFIPIMVGVSEIPNFLRNTLAEMVADFTEENLNKVVFNINRAVAHFNAISVEKQKSKDEQIQKLETSKTEFIREAEERLGEKETSLRRSAKVWYFFGYVALLLGVASTFYLLNENLSGNLDAIKITLLSIKGIIGVGLLVALSKYAFTLAKSYMNESLKNSDRLHAISFGKFYLQAYGNVATPEDVKDVFQHWNIDKDSSFKELKSESFDPRIFESAIEIAKVITKNDKKSSKGT
jgi:hypothetical protein